MRYEASLIQMSENLQKTDAMYALICLSAVGLQISLNGTRCFLDGKYLLCLSADDTLQIRLQRIGCIGHDQAVSCSGQRNI